VRAARAEWHGLLADVRLDRIVFLDEFGATTNMTRTRARGPRGERVVCRAPHGHWKVLSTIAAMTTRGMLCSGTFDGATDTDTFVAYVREGLVPTLAAGQVVVMDNLPAHRSSKVDELIESAGAYVLRLPPYSPDLNPIEMAISKVKTLLRSAERRTVEALQAAIGDALTCVTPDDATAYVRHCGYGGTDQ
jgi:transposase